MKAISKANLPAQTGGAQGGPDLLDFDVIVSLLTASFPVWQSFCHYWERLPEYRIFEMLE